MSIVNEYIDKIAEAKSDGSKAYVFGLSDAGENAPNAHRFSGMAYVFELDKFIDFGGSKTKLFRNYKYREPTAEERSKALTGLFDFIFREDVMKEYIIETILRTRGDKNWEESKW